MTTIEAIELGIIQGITEFLPISSSGHLVLVEHLMGLSQSGVLFEVAVHLGTLLSILVIFFKDLKELILFYSSSSSKRMIRNLVVGTLPIFFVGLSFKTEIESIFHDISVVGIAFLITGIILLLTWMSKPRFDQLDGKKSFIIGLCQCFALLPGISRSGVTIGSGLLLGIVPPEAARFSFFLAIPALVGSGILTFGDYFSQGTSTESLTNITIGFFVSFLVGMIALKGLLIVLTKGKFHWFGLYCLGLGVVTLFS